MEGLKAVVVGRHGGGTLEGKLVAGAQRIEALAPLVAREQPDLAISFSSPEAARTAFGLAIPHYAINDSPHATAVARLTLPLSEKLFTPKAVLKEHWIEVGAREEMIVQYDALDPVVWLRDFEPNPYILEELGLTADQPIIVFRMEESFAAYLLGRVPTERSVVNPIIEKVLREYTEPVQVVVLPRYKEQTSKIKAAFKDRIVVPKKVVDGPSLLAYTSVFIGAGGTMTAEAALLGTPAISCYPREPTDVEKYLIRRGLVQRITDSDEASSEIIRVLENLNEIRSTRARRARELMEGMEDPLDVVIGHL